MTVLFPNAALVHRRCASMSRARGQEGHRRGSRCLGAPRVHASTTGKTDGAVGCTSRPASFPGTVLDSGVAIQRGGSCLGGVLGRAGLP